MRSVVLILISALVSISLLASIPDVSIAQGSQDELSDLAERTSRELLIGWKNGVTDAQRDEIIKQLGGMLDHRFTLIKADSVIFSSASEVQIAWDDLAMHGSVDTVEIVEQGKCGGSLTSSLTKSRGQQRYDSSTFESSINETSETGKRDTYTTRFPNASWRHIDYVHEAQEFAEQKEEVILAVISDRPQNSNGIGFYDGSLIRPIQWANSVEKNGVAGVDDDNNGYVDDIYGIDTIHIPNEGGNLSSGIINLIAGVANYDPDRLTNPAGKVKLMLITAFHELDVDPECGVNDYTVRTTNSALIEALEYVAKMGAKVAFVSGHYTYKKSPLVIAAAEAFPGLIIVPSDRYRDQECFGDTSMLLQAGLKNVIGVGTVFDNTMAYSYGGKVDLLASLTHESPLYPGNEGGVVAGVTAHLMSCFPELTHKQIKDLLLSSIDRITDRRALRWRSNRTNGKLNAARAVLGRSAGGSFYIGDWALVDRKGPPYYRSVYGLVYDARQSLLYLYGGDGYDPILKQYRTFDDFWCWDGVQWHEIPQVKEPDKYPGTVEFYTGSIPFLFDENRREPMMITSEAVWRWDGLQWHARPAQLPIESRSPIRFPVDDCAYDAKRDRIYIYYEFDKLGPRMVEFNGTEWVISKNPTPLPGIRTSLVYNNRLGMITAMTSTEDDLHTGKMWGYNGKRWRRLQMETVVGTKGKLIYDARHNRYLRFGSENLSFFGRGPDGKTPYWYATDIWQMENGQWRNLGYDAPPFVFTEHFNKYAVWAEDQQRALFTVSRNTPPDRMLTWQYSGAITPTWIDNMILPQSDYTGNGKADLTLWHPATGTFRTENGTVEKLGEWGDIPVPGDYDGDGTVEFAVCRSIPGKETLDFGRMSWIFEDKKIVLGQFNDIPVPLDYNGDGTTDIATFRKDTAQWIFQDKSKNTKFGNPADLPVPADYNGDGIVELATYTPLTSTWHIQGIGDFQYGKPGDSPIPADFDGDGRADIATWNPRKRMWLVRGWSSGENLIKQRFGGKWDIPVPGDYDGDGAVELATYSPITSLWKIQGRTPIKFGTAGDVPLVRGN